MFLSFATDENRHKMVVLPLCAPLCSIEQPLEFIRFQRTIVLAEPFDLAWIEESIAVLTGLILDENRERIGFGVQLVSADVLRHLFRGPSAQAHHIEYAVFFAMQEPMVL